MQSGIETKISNQKTSHAIDFCYENTDSAIDFLYENRDFFAAPYEKSVETVKKFQSWAEKYKTIMQKLTDDFYEALYKSAKVTYWITVSEYRRSIIELQSGRAGSLIYFLENKNSTDVVMTINKYSKNPDIINIINEWYQTEATDRQKQKRLERQKKLQQRKEREELLKKQKEEKVRTDIQQYKANEDIINLNKTNAVSSKKDLIQIENCKKEQERLFKNLVLMISSSEKNAAIVANVLDQIKCYQLKDRLINIYRENYNKLVDGTKYFKKEILKGNAQNNTLKRESFPNLIEQLQAKKTNKEKDDLIYYRNRVVNACISLKEVKRDKNGKLYTDLELIKKNSSPITRFFAKIIHAVTTSLLIVNGFTKNRMIDSKHLRSNNQIWQSSIFDFRKSVKKVNKDLRIKKSNYELLKKISSSPYFLSDSVTSKPEISQCDPVSPPQRGLTQS